MFQIRVPSRPFVVTISATGVKIHFLSSFADFADLAWGFEQGAFNIQIPSALGERRSPIRRVSTARTKLAGSETGAPIRWLMDRPKGTRSFLWTACSVSTLQGVGCPQTR